MELKIGDTIFLRDRFRGLSKAQITKETNTTYQIGESTKVRKPFSDGCSAKGSGSWPTVHFYLPTASLEAEYERKILLNKAKKIKLEELSNEKLLSFIMLARENK